MHRLHWEKAISGTAEFYVYTTPHRGVVGSKLIHHVAHVAQDVDYPTPGSGGRAKLAPHRWIIHFDSRRHGRIAKPSFFRTKATAKAMVEKLFAGREG